MVPSIRWFQDLCTCSVATLSLGGAKKVRTLQGDPAPHQVTKTGPPQCSMILNAPGRGRACRADCKAPEAPGHLPEALAQLFYSSVWGGIGRDSQHIRDPSYPPFGSSSLGSSLLPGRPQRQRRVRSKASPLLVGISVLAPPPSYTSHSTHQFQGCIFWQELARPWQVDGSS